MKNNIINFDGKLFFNRHGLNEIGLSTEDTEAIYTYLLTQHKMHDGISGYIFINSVVNVRQYRLMFKRLELLEPQPLTRTRFCTLFVEFIREITGGYTYVPLKLCGFFKIEKPVQIRNFKFSEFRPINSAFANGHEIAQPDSFFVVEDDLISEISTGVTLLDKPTSSELETIKRIENELFFCDPDVVTAAKYQITGFDPGKVNLPTPREFKNGEEVKEETPHIDDSSEESPLVIDTLKRIIAASFWVLQNENRPKFKSKSSIYGHFHRHFGGIKGLKGSYIREFIKSAEDDLREREEEMGFKETYLDRVKLTDKEH